MREEARASSTALWCCALALRTAATTLGAQCACFPAVPCHLSSASAEAPRHILGWQGLQPEEAQRRSWSRGLNVPAGPVPGAVRPLAVVWIRSSLMIASAWLFSGLALPPPSCQLGVTIVSTHIVCCIHCAVEAALVPFCLGLIYDMCSNI